MWRCNHQVIQIANANTKQPPSMNAECPACYWLWQHLKLWNICISNVIDEQITAQGSHGMNVGFLVARPNKRREICWLKSLKSAKRWKYHLLLCLLIGFERLSFIWVSRTIAVTGVTRKIRMTPVSNYVISTIIYQVSCVTPTYRQPSVELGHPGAAWFLDRSKRSDQYQVFGPIKMRRLKTSWWRNWWYQIPKHYQTSLQGKCEWSYHKIQYPIKHTNCENIRHRSS